VKTVAVRSQNFRAIGKANLPKQTIWLFGSTIIVAFWAEAHELQTEGNDVTACGVID
jgi:hypothetical protein